MLQLLSSHLPHEKIDSCLAALGLIKPAKNPPEVPDVADFACSSGLDLTAKFSISPASKESKLAELGLRLFR